MLGLIYPENRSRSDPLTASDQQRATPLPPSPTGRFILGAYDSPVLEANESSPVPRIDVDRTISALQAAKVNTYAYLICPDYRANPQTSLTQLDQLPEFARRAGAAGIDVLVYLVPPTEAPEAAYQPYGWDYVRWFDHVGRLAAEQPAIKSVILDDFGGNVIARPTLNFHFTPLYTHRMTAAARRHAPGLSFLPVLYHHDLIGRHAVLSEYRHLIQGVVFPYFGYSDGRTVAGNTVDATKALSQGLEVSDALRCPRAAGCTQIVLPARNATDETVDTAVWSSTIVPMPGERRFVKVEVHDDAGSSADVDYRLQVVVDGMTVGTASRGTGWKERVFDLSAVTTRRSNAAVEVQLVRGGSGTERSRVTVQIGDIEGHGMTVDPEWTEPARMSTGLTSANTVDTPLVFMPYAVPLSAEQGQGASPAYFASVLHQMDVLRTSGRITGSLVFKLPLEHTVLGQPDPRYQILARTYTAWGPR
ncbi:hypothetical protein GCM10009616_22350 [Microlunatus lacustris]